MKHASHGGCNWLEGRICSFGNESAVGESLSLNQFMA